MMPWTYLGPSASEIAESLPGSSRNPSSRGWWSLRGICHGSGDKRGSTSLSISEKPHGKGIAVFCFRGCDRQTIIAALEYATGRRVEDAWTRDPHAPHGISVQRRRPPTTTSTPAQGDGQAQDMTALARRIWSAASAIPSDAGHPARLWMAARRLWRPDVPAPSALRWLDFSKGTPRPGGAIVACYAPLRRGGLRLQHLQLLSASTSTETDGRPLTGRKNGEDGLRGNTERAGERGAS